MMAAQYVFTASCVNHADDRLLIFEYVVECHGGNMLPYYFVGCSRLSRYLTTLCQSGNLSLPN